MAKVPFSKFNKIKTLPPKTVDFMGEKITVAQYLPLEEKLNLIQTVIELSGNGEEGFFNIVKLRTYYTIEMIKAYTNISFTEKQQEDITKLYDSIVLNNLWSEVEKAIPDTELQDIWCNLMDLAREVTNYNHSALGILKTVTTDYENLNFDADSIREKLSDPNNLNLLKAIAQKDNVG